MIRNCTFILSLFVFYNIGFCQIYGEPIVTWDFSSGIPEDWQAGVTSTNNVAQWEYRGPNTTPDFTVGARGSCSAIAVPIQSQSQENGFVIFDGNYWDDPGESCGAGFGTGTDPAPHTAWLITNPIDLSETDAAVLTFQQQYRHFQVSTSVYISTDSGSTWTEILVNTGVQSQSAEWKTVNISQWAANQPSVQFKFEYNGTYYWWLLDDISIYRPNDNDLRITKVQYTTNQIVNGLTTLNALEYHQYPISMLPSLKFKADILNVGGNNQTGVRLNAKLIKDNLEEVLNVTSSASTVNAGASANLSISGVYTPSFGEGDYNIRYSLLQDSSDDTPDNNRDSLDFVITPFTYGKDEGTMEDTYTPAAFYDDYQLTCGNFFENKESVRYCHTIQVGIGEGTSVGKEIRGVIYNESLDSLISTTPTYVVNYGDLNEPGEQRLMYLDFETPFELQPDSLYFVGVEEIDSIRPFFVARGGNSFGESSLVRYNNINASIISGKSFLVRLTILPLDEKPGCTDGQAINYESSADINDGSCDYPGCTNEDADNYEPDATFDNGTCQVGGCIDSAASNYNPLATYQNTECIYIGCTNDIALNYNPQANQDDGSCQFLSAQMNASILSGCPPFQFTANNINGEYPESTCAFSINGEQVSDVCSTTFQYEFLEPGTYELTYMITVGNAIDDTTITIEVFAEPDQPEIIYDTETHFLNCLNCANDNLEWQLDGETIEDASSTTLNAEFDGITQNGDYQLIATNSNGCSIISEILSVVQPHLAVSSPSGCIPFSVYLINTTDQIPGMTCSLNTGNTIIENFEGLIEVTFEEAGAYSPEITCSVGPISGTSNETITVYALEIPILILSDTADVIICENYESFTQFIWNVDGTVIEGGISQPAGNSVYQLQAYNEAGCGGSNLFIAISTEEIHDNSVYAYPNPANDFFQVQSTKPSALRIVNSLSQLVFESSKRSNNHSISTSTWPSGLYFLQWSDDVEWHTLKFEINH